MGADESSSSSLDHSDMMIVAEESSRKRKLPAEESDLLPSSKHFCLEQQQQQQASLPDSSCPSSDIESAECSSAMEDTKTSDETSSSASVCMSKDSSYSTGSSSWSCGYTASGIDQCCSKGNDKIQKYVEDLEFICPEFDVEKLRGFEDSNVEGSYTLSSTRWSASSNQESGEATKKPTIDQEFEEYFSTLMM